MKEYIKNHKNLCIGIAAALCVVLCIAAGTVAFALIGDSKEEVTQEAKKEKATQTISVEEEPQETEEVEEVSEEAVTQEAVSEEAAEVVEDSELDVVAQTDPAANAVKEAVQEAASDGNITVNASDMAQNAQFPYEIHVNKQMNCVTVYAMDKNGAYSIPYKAMVCSTGKATPLGTYKTPVKYVWKVLKGGVWGQYSTRITGSILFHSVPYMAQRKDSLKSSYYNKLGTTASAGCIRLTTADAKWIYDNCPLGTTVVIYNDGNPGPLGKPSAMKVPESNKWDPTDPDPANPWRGKVLRIEGVQPLYIKERGLPFDAMSGVKAIDANGNDITASVHVSTNADVNTTGIYALHYTVTDSMGNTATADATLQILDTQAPSFAGIPGRVEGHRNEQITRELLLRGVSVTDNALPFSIDAVEVHIPALHDGENQIVYVATDASGNRATATTIVVCDNTAPTIAKRAGSSILALNEQMTQDIALARVEASDVHGVTLNCQVVDADWGYVLNYTAQDSYGNVSNYTERVSYVVYSFAGSDAITVSSIEDMAQLKSGLVLQGNNGDTMPAGADVSVTTSQVSANVYHVTYQYVYHCARGSRTASFTRVVTVQ